MVYFTTNIISNKLITIKKKKQKITQFFRNKFENNGMYT